MAGIQSFSGILTGQRRAKSDQDGRQKFAVALGANRRVTVPGSNAIQAENEAIPARIPCKKS